VTLADSSNQSPVARSAPTQPLRTVPAPMTLRPTVLVEDEILVDVGLEEARPGDDGEVVKAPRVDDPGVDREDARERRRDVLRDVDGIDRPDALPNGTGEREVIERSQEQRPLRQEHGAGRRGALVGLAMDRVVLEREAALVDRRI